MAQGLHGARRPRPVADIARPALADGASCAKGWLLALVAAAPLEEVGALPTAELATEAPELCAAVLLALGADREVERLGPGGDRTALAARAGRLAGAADAAGVARAVGLLREAVWDALLDELDRRDGELVAAAAARLAHVCDVVAQAALSAVVVADPPSRGRGGRPLAPVHGGGGGEDGVDDSSPSLRPVGGEEQPPRLGPVGVDDRSAPLRPVGGDRQAPLLGPVGVVGDEVVARRGGAAAEPWLEAIAVRVERHGADGEPFAVLAVEVDDAERLLAADADGEALRAITRAEAAVRRAASAADAVVREHPGRLWVVVGIAGAGDARALGERVAEAAAEVVLRGAPLTVSIGVATCPEDGGDAATLAAHADEGVFAARAAGVRLA